VLIIHQKENKRKGEKGACQHQKTLMITRVPDFAYFKTKI
jgi:hypothetical protein